MNSLVSLGGSYKAPGERQGTVIRRDKDRYLKKVMENEVRLILVQKYLDIYAQFFIMHTFYHLLETLCIYGFQIFLHQNKLIL